MTTINSYKTLNINGQLPLTPVKLSRIVIGVANSNFLSSDLIAVSKDICN